MRKLIDFVISILGKIKKNQVINPLPDQNDGLVKINLGCGLRVSKGWTNIDGSLNALIASFPNFLHGFAYRFTGSKNYYSLDDYKKILRENKFIYHDLSYSLPLPKNSVNFIYSSHFFEHLFKDDTENLLKACYDSLKKDGLIRISIPDLEYAVSLYKLGKKTHMLDHYFFVAGKGSYLARHKYMYDFELINKLLQNAGFKNIKKQKYQKGKSPDINELDIYPEVSLFVEAEKKV